ncbi:hypothetical protein K6W26_32675 [Burkholderia sp. AU42008]|uniref:hypothetical protein n=1 Tax=unclassified Burkholderia TaxID=2613784 RepID=UPI0015C6590E|nr:MULTISPECIES: hypothetical protein [unclassified Burkholderia]MBR8237769.1 hypothetical protein [Burkholderia sp. AU32357]MBY4877817.1 hypothetical protein [Burkholderia sp. AU42008]
MLRSFLPTKLTPLPILRVEILRAGSGKRQAASGKRQAASGKRQAASGKRQAASGKHIVTHKSLKRQ